MAGQQYVALLRGINVGGRNAVPMADLRAAVEADGHTDVRTYIQSGNVLLRSATPAAELEDRLEAALEARFGFPIVVVVRSGRQLRNVVAQAPPGFGGQPDTYHSDVIFLKAPLTPKQAMGVVQLRDEVDQAWTGTGVLYFARLSARRTQSKMSKIVGTPEYRLMTIRSWSTRRSSSPCSTSGADGEAPSPVPCCPARAHPGPPGPGRRPMRNRTAHLLLCGAVLLGGLAACGDDGDGGGSDRTEERDDAGDGGRFDFDNQVLADFCNDVADYIEDARAVMEDPSDAAAVAEMQTRGRELATRGQELQTSLGAGDIGDLEECSQFLEAGAG